jgi:hypothetical protein
MTAPNAVLPSDFQFTPASLQDFVDCPARFYLRHIRQMRYPAPEAEPLGEVERHAARAAQFRQLIRQAELGIPAKALEASIHDDVVGSWWKAHQAHPPADLPPSRKCEVVLSTPLAGRRLAARCDLLAIAPERAVIVLWKTAPRRPPRAWLEQRVESIALPYLLARAGAHLNGGTAFAPENIRLVYWFAASPDAPETFDYSAARFERDEAHLNALAADILERAGEAAFELTDNIERCRFCSYRALHDRGTQAGDFNALMDDTADDPTPRFDIDQIGEMAF